MEIRGGEVETCFRKFAKDAAKGIEQFRMQI